MLINDAIERYLDYAANQRRLSQGSVVVYRRELGDFAYYLHTLGIDTVEDITTREPRQWQALRMEEGLKPTSIKKMLSALRGWTRYMLQQRWIEADIMARVSQPRVPKPLPVFFKEAEVEHIYDAELFANDFNGHRDRLLLRLLYETGMRRAELAGLRLQSVDHSARLLRITGKRNKERLIPIEPELMRAIDEFIALRDTVECEDDHLLVSENGRAVTYAQVYTIVKRYMTALSAADRISPHVFRHTFATHILNEGGNVEAIRQLLGHSSLNATEIYTHVTREHLRENYRHAHPRAKDK